MDKSTNEYFSATAVIMNSMKLVIPIHVISLKKTPNDAVIPQMTVTMPESIHTKDESKCGTAFAFIFGVN